MNCKICGTYFEPTHPNQRICSDDCRKQSQRIAKAKYKKTEKGKEATKRWHQSQRFKDNEKRYRQKPEAKKKAVARQREYLKRHPEQIAKRNERDRAYSQTERGREVRKEAEKRYRNTEKGKLARRKTKYARRAAGAVDKRYLENLLKNNVCYYCGREIEGKKTIDHKTPIAKGGTNDSKNLVLACVHCNCQKGDKTEEEYRRWLDENNL